MSRMPGKIFSSWKTIELEENRSRFGFHIKLDSSGLKRAGIRHFFRGIFFCFLFFFYRNGCDFLLGDVCRRWGLDSGEPWVADCCHPVFSDAIESGDSGSFRWPMKVHRSRTPMALRKWPVDLRCDRHFNCKWTRSTASICSLHSIFFVSFFFFYVCRFIFDSLSLSLSLWPTATLGSKKNQAPKKRKTQSNNEWDHAFCFRDALAGPSFLFFFHLLANLFRHFVVASAMASTINQIYWVLPGIAELENRDYRI